MKLIELIEMYNKLHALNSDFNSFDIKVEDTEIQINHSLDIKENVIVIPILDYEITRLKIGADGFFCEIENAKNRRVEK